MGWLINLAIVGNGLLKSDPETRLSAKQCCLQASIHVYTPGFLISSWRGSLCWPHLSWVRVDVIQFCQDLAPHIHLGHLGTFEGTRRIRLIVVIIGDGGKSGDHPGTADDPTGRQLNRRWHLYVIPRSTFLPPSSTQPLILSPGLTSSGEVTSQATMTQLHVWGHPTTGTAPGDDLTKMGLPVTGTRHTCIFENWDNFRSDISLFASPPSEEPSFQTLRNKISCNIFLRMISSNWIISNRIFAVLKTIICFAIIRANKPQVQKAQRCNYKRVQTNYSHPSSHFGEPPLFSLGLTDQ